MTDKEKIAVYVTIAISISLLIGLIISIIYDYHTYSTMEKIQIREINNIKNGDYVYFSGTISNYIGIDTDEHLICTKGCWTSYKTYYVYTVKDNTSEVTGLFNDNQSVGDKITIKGKKFNNFVKVTDVTKSR